MLIDDILEAYAKGKMEHQPRKTLDKRTQLGPLTSHNGITTIRDQRVRELLYWEARWLTNFG